MIRELEYLDEAIEAEQLGRQWIAKQEWVVVGVEEVRHIDVEAEGLVPNAPYIREATQSGGSIVFLSPVVRSRGGCAGEWQYVSELNSSKSDWKERLLGHLFTKLQGQYLAFIVAYVKLNRRSPAEVDFQRYFEETPPSVHNMILTLERRGLIRRPLGQPRSVEVVVPLSEIPPLD